MTKHVAPGGMWPVCDMSADVATGLPDDIMDRRCPKFRRFQHPNAQDVRVSTRKRLKPYALKVRL